VLAGMVRHAALLVFLFSRRSLFSAGSPIGTARRSTAPEISYVADFVMVPIQQPKLLCSTRYGVTCHTPSRRVCAALRTCSEERNSSCTATCLLSSELWPFHRHPACPEEGADNIL